MNLADIRKKAEENRRAVPVEQMDEPVKGAAESLLPPELETPDVLFFEEPPYSPFEMPEEYFPAEPSIDETVTMEQPAPKSEPAPGVNDLCAAPLADPAVSAGQEEKPGQPATAAPAPSPPSPAAKKPAVYNPIETILSGRAAVAATEDQNDSQTDFYAAEDVEEYLCFRVAHEEYAISIMTIKEIIKPREVTEVPRVPAFISGVISLRGVIIPVMDMRRRLSLPESASAGKARIIVVRKDTGFCGVLVDEVIQVARINRRDIEEPPAVLDGIDRDFVTGLGHFDNRLLILLNLATILDVDVH